MNALPFESYKKNDLMNPLHSSHYEFLKKCFESITFKTIMNSWQLKGPDESNIFKTLWIKIMF